MNQGVLSGIGKVTGGETGIDNVEEDGADGVKTEADNAHTDTVLTTR